MFQGQKTHLKKYRDLVIHKWQEKGQHVRLPKAHLMFLDTIKGPQKIIFLIEWILNYTDK